jgi:hypothetical protein
VQTKCCHDAVKDSNSTLESFLNTARTQIRVHHFCSHLNKDMRQCILTDSSEKGARIIGIKYMISNDLFEGLDAEEKKLWHSHDYEVRTRMHA